jgi:hypothetical protein
VAYVMWQLRPWIYIQLIPTSRALTCELSNTAVGTSTVVQLYYLVVDVAEHPSRCWTCPCQITCQQMGHCGSQTAPSGQAGGPHHAINAPETS